MRPIHLSIAGLHSFREKQEIDFEKLCAGGVFGIFGPTGSGKSTILDAITLALYGKVERATNNTQGIMNHAVDTLSVSFTFQLGKQTVKRYRVERTYKRTGEVSMRISTCRLVERDETGEEVVLADKEREVTATVQQLLGLTNDDFTRAVVLPQGKFAEFLSLKGVERRQMLQRLFHLEKYGDRLNNRLKTRLDQVIGELDKVLAEQQGLGEASLETLTALKHRLEETTRFAKERKEELIKLETYYEEKKQIWQWQQELQLVEQQLEQLRDRLEEIEKIEARLKLSHEAMMLKPYAEEFRRAQREVDDWRGQVKRLHQEVADSRQSFLKSKANFEAVEQRRKMEEPQLIARQERLKQAKEIEEQLSQKTAELHRLRKDLQQIEEEYKTLELSLAKEKALYDKALVKQKELKDRHAQLQVSSELRIKIRQATEAKQGIRYEQSKYAELEREGKQREHTWQQEQKKQAELAEQAKLLETQVTGQLRQATKLYQEIKQLATQLEDVCWQLEQEIQQETELLAREREQQLAYQLAQSLRQGEPCPVCGSIEHPHPNLSEGNVILEKRKERIRRLEETQAEGRNAQHKLDKLAYQLEQLLEVSAEAVSTLERGVETKQAVSITTDRVHSVEAETERESSDLTEETQVEERLQVLLRAAQSSEQAVHAVEHELKLRLKKWRELDREQREQAQFVDRLEQEVGDLQKRLKELAKLIYQEQITWQKNFPTFQLETIEEEQAKLDARDQEVAELARRIETSVTFIQEKEDRISQLQQRLNQLQMNKVELVTTCAQLEEQQGGLRKQVREYVGAEGQIEALMQQVQVNLQELLALEQKAFAQFQQDQQTFQNKEKEEGIALESLNQAEKRWQLADRKWQEYAQGSRFTDVETVFKALIPLEEQNKLSEQVRIYREQEQKCLQEKERLLGLLSGKQISDEEWRNLQTSLEEAKERRDQAIQLVAKAARDLEEMQEKHERYQQLEEKRLTLAKKKEQLTKLSTVLRGNSFVEYVATEQLMEVSRDASYRLGQLTRQRYALEVDSGLGFVIRDNHNGGVKRPITSLSGGETFLTSLALALALSAQIQLRGEYPLEFFFLDEGFGTLDQELLDTVITALEKLHTDHLSVGVISHVPELRARLPRQLIVQPETAEQGTSVRIVP